MCYRSSLLPAAAFDVDIWPKVPFAGSDSLAAVGESRFYSAQMNVAFQAVDPFTNQMVTWRGQNAIEVGLDGSLSWGMWVYEPSEYSSQGLNPTPFFSARNVIDYDPSQTLALLHFHWDGTGTLEWDIRPLDPQGYPVLTPVHEESHQLPLQFQGPPLTCITDIVGYDSGSTTTFTQMEAEICTNAYTEKDGYADNGVLEPNPWSVPDLVGYGLPGSSEAPPPVLPVFLTAENSNTNSVIIYQQGGTVREEKQVPDWETFL